MTDTKEYLERVFGEGIEIKETEVDEVRGRFFQSLYIDHNGDLYAVEIISKDTDPVIHKLEL